MFPEKNYINRIKSDLFRIPDVKGAGIGIKTVNGISTADKALIVLVSQKRPLTRVSVKKRIPAFIDGIPIDVVESGKIFSQNQLQERQRPAAPGMSMAHVSTRTGTLGAVVQDVETGEKLLLSNNHVFANRNRAKTGDSIIQPGKLDGGIEHQDVIARLDRFVPLNLTGKDSMDPIVIRLNILYDFLLNFLGVQATYAFKKRHGNLIDAALAKPVDDNLILDSIKEIGKIKGVADPEMGMEVQKCGSSTGLTTGTIKYIKMDTRIHFKNGQTALMLDHIITTPMSEYGDSGAVLIDKQNRAVGLLCGGSEQVSIFSPIKTVLGLLKIKLAE